MDFTNLDIFGAPFDHVETYVYYEGPKAFALRSRSLPLYYIVNTVDEDEESGTVTNLVAAVDEDRFKAVRSGLIPFGDAFRTAGRDGLWSVVWEEFGTDMRPTVTALADADIPLSWLPAAHARLSLPTATVDAFHPEELQHLATSQNRTLFALRVDTPPSAITALPARVAGSLQTALHSVFDSLVSQHWVKFATHARQRDLVPSVVGLRAASFVVVFAVESRGSIIEPTEVTEPVMSDMLNLVNAINEESDEFIRVMREHAATTLNQFQDILASLSGLGSGVSLTAAPAFRDEILTASASGERVRAAVTALASAEPEVDHFTIDRGILLGSVLRTRRFEIVDAAAGALFKGSMSEAAAAQADGLVVGEAGYVRAGLREETAFATQARSYTLEWIEAREP